jgi:hypothetical protein
MSRVDEQGYLHPTDSDPISMGAELHLLYCRECNPYALPKPKPEEDEAA